MIRAGLRKLELLSELSDWELDRFQNMVREIRVAEGTTLTSQGESATSDEACAWVVVAGSVRVSRSASAVASAAEVTLGPGSFLGVIALVLDHPRAATLTAATDTRLLAIDRRSFERMYETDSRLAVKFRLVVARQLARDLRRINSTLAAKAPPPHSTR